MPSHTEKITYHAFNFEVFNQVPDSAINILDVGCGSGELGRELKAKVANRKLTGITYSEEEAILARLNLDNVIVGDINIELPVLDQNYDCIIFSHILEHTYNPIYILTYFKNKLQPNGSIIIALPNILFYKQRMQFLLGRFQYSKTGGLMDITHFRFFDWNSAQQLIKDSELTIISKIATGNFPLGLCRKWFKKISFKIDSYFLKKFPGLFGFQFILIASN